MFQVEESKSRIKSPMKQQIWKNPNIIMKNPNIIMETKSETFQKSNGFTQFKKQSIKCQKLHMESYTTIKKKCSFSLSLSLMVIP